MVGGGELRAWWDEEDLRPIVLNVSFVFPCFVSYFHTPSLPRQQQPAVAHILQGVENEIDFAIGLADGRFS